MANSLGGQVTKGKIINSIYKYMHVFKNQNGLPWWLRWYRICLQFGRHWFSSWAGKIPWRRVWLPTPLFLSGKLLWTEEPVGLQSMGSQSWTRLSNWEREKNQNIEVKAKKQYYHFSFWYHISKLSFKSDNIQWWWGCWQNRHFHT